MHGQGRLSLLGLNLVGLVIGNQFGARSVSVSYLPQSTVELDEQNNHSVFKNIATV